VLTLTVHEEDNHGQRRWWGDRYMSEPFKKIRTEEEKEMYQILITKIKIISKRHILVS
jgi:hypothetical protein